MKLRALGLLLVAGLALSACSTTKPAVETKETKSAVSGDMYRIREGESLQSIAEREYGSRDEWVVLYKANKDVIGDNPHMVYPGQMIVIPDMK